MGGNEEVEDTETITIRFEGPISVGLAKLENCHSEATLVIHTDDGLIVNKALVEHLRKEGAKFSIVS